MIHPNSIETYHSLNLSERYRKILSIYQLYSRELTDREVKRLGGFEDMNEVRPRITELVGMKKLKECGKKTDEKTHKPVRLTRIMTEDELLQQELF